MKISMNPINNYNIQPVNQAKKSAQIQSRHVDTLSKDEKKFFAEVYPENKNEIMDYHYYAKDGKLSGISIGSNIDKRG